jgi:hypothetical protein
VSAPDEVLEAIAREQSLIGRLDREREEAVIQMLHPGLDAASAHRVPRADHVARVRAGKTALARRRHGSRADDDRGGARAAFGEQGFQAMPHE